MLCLAYMRKESFVPGEFYHVYNRGNRKREIVRDAKDRWHFLQLLYYCNNEDCFPNSFREIKGLFKLSLNKPFQWPKSWPSRKPIVKILAFSLMENHFHLLLKEIKEGGISAFMQRFGTGMTKYFNEKYQETGRLFQGPYKAKLVDEDLYLRYLSVYIQVKNPFELYPGGGIKRAMKEFDKAYEFAADYAYCSLGDYAGKRNSPIIDKDILADLFPTPREYKKFARECILGMNIDTILGDIAFNE